MAVVSGSVSAVTGVQIEKALADGFESVPFDAAALLQESQGGTATIDDAVLSALSVLEKGGMPLIHTARGPDDPAVNRFRDAQQRCPLDSETANARVGEALGAVLRQIIVHSGNTRAIVCGGDTSGHATRQLGVHAMSALAETVPGAALFKVHAGDVVFDGLQLALKGGQMGTPDYFHWIKQGGGSVEGRG
jgi:uncharacterized protein YgbK (DUF1537 family)